MKSKVLTSCWIKVHTLGIDTRREPTTTIKFSLTGTVSVILLNMQQIYMVASSKHISKHTVAEKKPKKKVEGLKTT